VRLRGRVHQRLDGELVAGPGAATRHGVGTHQGVAGPPGG
jgi:hypothetical protein